MERGDSDDGRNRSSLKPVGLFFSAGIEAFRPYDSEDVVQSKNWQSTMICLFNDYDLPLPCESFMAMTHLGQEKWALSSNTGHCPSVNLSDGSHPFSNFQPQDITRSFSHGSHIPSTSFLLNGLYILPLLWYVKWSHFYLNRMAAVVWGFTLKLQKSYDLYFSTS